MVGTAVAGGLLLSGSTPILARGVPSGTVARAAVPSGTGYSLTNSEGDVYAFGSATSCGTMAGKHLIEPGRTEGEHAPVLRMTLLGRGFFGAVIGIAVPAASLRARGHVPKCQPKPPAAWVARARRR